MCKVQEDWGGQQRAGVKHRDKSSSSFLLLCEDNKSVKKCVTLFIHCQFVTCMTLFQPPADPRTSKWQLRLSDVRLCEGLICGQCVRSSAAMSERSYINYQLISIWLIFKKFFTTCSVITQIFAVELNVLTTDTLYPTQKCWACLLKLKWMFYFESWKTVCKIIVLVMLASLCGQF